MIAIVSDRNGPEIRNQGYKHNKKKKKFIFGLKIFFKL